MAADYYPLATEPATPEYLLNLIEALGRNTAANSSKGLPVRETSLNWFPLLDSWNERTVFFNRLFGANANPRELQAALEGKESIGGLCDFYAPLTVRKKIRPWRGAGSECLPAGLF
jgi:hypothetical protein